MATDPAAHERSDLTGILNVDKPRGWTSHDVVGRVRRLAHQKRVGHAGTLDPMATGVLVILLGRATRLADVVQTTRKTYCATVVLGAATDTDDAEGSITQRSPVPVLSRTSIESALEAFRGPIVQMPPAYSALKVAGQRAYALARRGEQVDLAPRPVTIDRLSLLSHTPTGITFEVACSKGTYVRALARDIARALGTVGHLSALVRTAVGPFLIEHAWSLDELALRGVEGAIEPPSRALPDTRTIVVSEVEAERLRHGQVLRHASAQASADGASGWAWVVDWSNHPICLANAEDGALRPQLML